MQIVRVARIGIILCLGVMPMTRASAAEPIGRAALRTEGQATTFSASGTIDRVYRHGATITFISARPFWGPPRYGSGPAFLWPAKTVFVLFIAGPTPVTLDGKRSSCGKLAAGQTVDVRYNLELGFFGGVSCVAARVDAHSPSTSKVSEPRKAAGKR